MKSFKKTVMSCYYWPGLPDFLGKFSPAFLSKANALAQALHTPAWSPHSSPQSTLPLKPASASPTSALITKISIGSLSFTLSHQNPLLRLTFSSKGGDCTFFPATPQNIFSFS